MVDTQTARTPILQAGVDFTHCHRGRCRYCPASIRRACEAEAQVKAKKSKKEG